MLTTETVRTNPTLSEDQALRVAELWTIAYPEMRAILDRVIKAQREFEKPTRDVKALEQVRLELGQLDRGTYRGCTRGGPMFSVHAARSAVHEVLNVTWLGHPGAGNIYRLAGELADLAAAANERMRAEDEARRAERAQAAQSLDRVGPQRADSKEQSTQGASA
ncbi:MULTISPECIES: hypothetical protein [unclassified Streptomyces]|uniref:hypothetical protein n=1 Tax=unclassified Streptomyces TaxID=2593676 RepID=UPI00226DFE96|nr:MULTISPECIES: hypothetical protein [unclassified Streptomyces]MCY0923914.1 hypothetical protein [Streptomyces sp. H27-G5]MCY0962033.1 hypothetical protein [Streptomyces sp. H27-H5]